MPARAIGHSGDAGEIAVRAPQKFFCIPLQGRRRQFSLAVKLHNVTVRAPKPKKAPRPASSSSRSPARLIYRSGRIERRVLGWRGCIGSRVCIPRRIMDECALRNCLVRFCRKTRRRPEKNSHKPRAPFSVRLVRFDLLHRAIRAASRRKVTSKTPRGTCRRAFF